VTSPPWASAIARTMINPRLRMWAYKAELVPREEAMVFKPRQRNS
jgi:hypothetical protein